MPPPPAPGGAGCQGRTADALARGAEEGRGEQRYSRARRTRPLTPGCPNGGTRQARACHPPAEHIGRGEATGGTETSKYPEEGKSTETPRVAASERGPAQTGRAHERLGAARPGLWARETGGQTPRRRSERREGAEPDGSPGGTGLQPRRPKLAPRRPAARSTAGHVKPGGKQGGPPSKAKHYPVTDSGQVP